SRMMESFRQITACRVWLPVSFENPAITPRLSMLLGTLTAPPSVWSTMATSYRTAACARVGAAVGGSASPVHPATAMIGMRYRRERMGASTKGGGGDTIGGRSHERLPVP